MATATSSHLPGGIEAAAAPALAMATSARSAESEAVAHDRQQPDEDAPPDFDDEDAQLDSLIDLEESMRAEQMQHDAQQQDDEDEEGGGFFRDDAEEQQAAAAATSNHHTAAGSSTAATASPAADAGSIAEDAPARPFAVGCRECGSIGIQASFLAAFGVSVCFRCQQVHKSRYALCTQTTCTTEWMLPLVQVQGLGCIEKKNPHKQAWGVMKLYWKQQVLALVRARFGTREALEAAKHERDLTRIRKDDSKRRNAHHSAARSAAFASTLAATMSDLGTQTPAEVVALLQARTRGMAPTNDRAKDTRSRKRKQEPVAAALPLADAADDSSDEVMIVDRPAPSSRKKKSAKSSGSAASSSSVVGGRKPLHTHSFRVISDGRQRCSDPACAFTMEFESF